MIRKFAATGLALGVVMSMAIVAVAVADGGSTFTGCLDDKGNLSSVAEGPDPTSECDRKSRAVHWNAEGPAGTQGPEGTPGADGRDGADGDVGPQGPPGVDGEDGSDGNPCTVSDDGEGTITLTCPDGSAASWAGTTTTTESPPSGLDLFDAPIVTDGFSSLPAEATLTWVGGADLDLHAADGVPTSDHDHAYFGNPVVEGSARLELLGDAHAMCSDEDHTVRSEVITIQAGQPVDVFFWVDVAESCGVAVPEWTLTIEAEGGERWSVVGNLDMATGPRPADLLVAPYLATFGF